VFSTLSEGSSDVDRSCDDDNLGFPVDEGSLDGDTDRVSVKDSEEKREGNSLGSEVVDNDTLLSIIRIKPFES